jgi:hypothetical protein
MDFTRVIRLTRRRCQRGGRRDLKQRVGGQFGRLFR